MCGIIGIFGENNPRNRAKKSLEKIVHRGSSVFELEFFKNGALGVNRLPIVDREHGKQPKSNEDKTIFSILNGEIFNYRELKKTLIKKGHNFETDSDTEVLAHLYEEYGPKMVNMLDSEMFAFVIYDKRDNSIFAARDALGIKPLYYAHDNTKQIYFASELKQLSFFDDIKTIYNFPPGTYFLHDQFTKYSRLKIDNGLTNEKETIRLLEKQIVNAIKKRVDTDLPIGVFLSGGVDSSLIMEIATRLHPDVTAIILGYPGSPDYEFAMRLCKERKYKYHVVRPDVDYEKELDAIIYHLETYEPLIIRQSFSLDMCAREAQRLGLRIVLAGEGSDELFGGYNEFSGLPTDLINKGCLMLAESLNQGHFLRVDRMSMKHTVEIRLPFFDKEIVSTAFKVDGSLKIKKENHQITTKYIIRKLATNFLPEYVAWRYKVPFSNGAGMNVGNNFKAQDGDVAKIVLGKPEVDLPSDVLRKYSITTKEEKYYLFQFQKFGFCKLVGSENRLTVKDNLNDLYQSDKTRFLVAEFARLAIYFPTYFAAEKKIFDLHKLDVDFIATGGDDKTYESLVNNSAHIGLSDPMFAMFENKEGVKGEIIGELVNIVPNLAVTLNPSVKISKIDDFEKYKIGTFQKYSTTHGIAKYILPKETKILDFDYKQLVGKLIDGSVDIAIVIPEQAIELKTHGGRIVFDFGKEFPKVLFSGFTIANILEEKYRKHLKSFIISVRESVRYIKKNKEEAFKVFNMLFPNFENPKEIFKTYLRLWSPTLRVEKEDYNYAYRIWKKNYPELLKAYTPYFRSISPSDLVIDKINGRNFRRDFPFLEDVLQERIVEAKNKNEPLKFIGFWGAGHKNQIDANDRETIKFFKKYIADIKGSFKNGVEVTWILADEHAKNNKYRPEVYSKYLKEVEKMLIENNFKVLWLKNLWSSWRINSALINRELKNKNAKNENWWSNILIYKELEDQAKKHYQGMDKVVGAKRYYIMKSIENRLIEKKFKEYIFFTFSDSKFQSIFPKLPTIYLYTRDRGVSSTPWFNEVPALY